MNAPGGSGLTTSDTAAVLRDIVPDEWMPESTLRYSPTPSAAGPVSDRVPHVHQMRIPLKIAQAVVGRPAIPMPTLRPLGCWPNKGQEDESVDEDYLRLPVASSESDSQIAPLVRRLLQETGRRYQPATAAPVGAHSPLIAHLVAHEAGDGPPLLYCAHEGPSVVTRGVFRPSPVPSAEGPPPVRPD